MNLLLHTCCGPCAVKCIETLKNEGVTPDLFWHNPNIHPFTEYISRLESLTLLAERTELNLITFGEYGLRSFLAEIGTDYDERCPHCYRMRLVAVAKYAAENGYDGFSTTLLISPYQNHEMIKDIGEALANEYGIDFVYRDFRPHFREGQKQAREIGLYMQKYCGCIFSEEERYFKGK